jgi:hypothetical protein
MLNLPGPGEQQKKSGGIKNLQDGLILQQACGLQQCHPDDTE